MGKSTSFSILILTLALASSFLDSANAVWTSWREPRQEGGNHRERSGYGQACSNTVKCESASWLSCQNSTCQCFRPNEMKYDESIRKCVSQIGERCRFGINQGSGSGSGSDDMVIYALTGCDTNAHCNTEGICVCNSTFFESANGDCTPKRGHRKSCNSEAKTETEAVIQCLDNQGLSCQAGKCRCADLKAVYSEAESQCVGLGGQPCINSKCSQHANCSIENTCECQNDFYLNSDNGVCLPKIAPLQNCTGDEQCRQIGSQPLVCLDGVCNCNPAKSVYATARVSVHLDGTRDYNEFQGFEGTDLTQCAGLVGSECVDRLCVTNAFCSYSVPLFIIRETTTTTTTQRPARFSYDYGNGDYYEVSQENNKYAASVYNPIPTPPHQFLFIIEPKSQVINHSGTCKCTPSYTKTNSHRCAAPLNSACDSTSDCADGLICQNLKCVCPYNIQTYDRVKSTCVSKIGGPCDPSPNNPALSCGENAFCKAINSTLKNPGQKIAGHCACQNGLVETMEGNCMTGYGGPCRVAPDCDSIAQLDCIDKKCACPAFQEYNPSLRKCVGLVGTKCQGISKYECTANAHCSETIHENFPGSCSCNEGFEENHDYTCDPVAVGVIVADDDY